MLRFMLLSILALAAGCKACTSHQADDTAPVDLDGDGAPADEDCDDGDASVYPGADELCDGVDNDCDAVVDEADAVDASSWYPDVDGDGYGDAAAEAVVACEAPAADDMDNADDCDDTAYTSNPDAPELCADGLDNDCDSETDEADAQERPWYKDGDDDGYGVDDDVVYGCELPEGYADLDGDCDDEDAEINPGALDPADGVDEDCDGAVDDDLVNFDGEFRIEDSDDFDDLTTRDCVIVFGVHGTYVPREPGDRPDGMDWVYELTWTYLADESYDGDGCADPQELEDYLNSDSVYAGWVPDADGESEINLWSSADMESWETWPWFLGGATWFKGISWDEATGHLTWAWGVYEDPNSDYTASGITFSTTWFAGDLYVVPPPSRNAGHP